MFSVNDVKLPCGGLDQITALCKLSCCIISCEFVRKECV